MILRNRDLNVQQNGAEQAGQQQKRKGSLQGGQNAAVKRQAAHLIINNKEQEPSSREQVEPKPKRTCRDAQSSSILQEFSANLCIDSARRNSSSSFMTASEEENNQQQQENRAPEPEVKQEEQPKQEELLVEPKQEKEVVTAVMEFDKENAKDFASVSDYVRDIFNYYKFREHFFRISDYTLVKQPRVNHRNRASLVDWLVELQETFELNHETLYLSVKLFDLFMDRCRKQVQPSDMKLIASAAVFISAKYDERAPPLIEDFIYLAENAFTHNQMMAMERELLKIVDFDLGAPLSYRFLRRYARIAREDMGTLTLARYALELSLMSLDFCRESESKIAAACLLLAKRMKGTGNDEWFRGVLQEGSGYSMAELEPLMWKLNGMLVNRVQLFGQHLDNVFRKYSHEIFFEVAKIPTLVEEPPQPAAAPTVAPRHQQPAAAPSHHHYPKRSAGKRHPSK